MACLLLIVLAVAVLTTVQVGQTVHERMRAQDAVDAEAYSTAALEARAFNVYALTNRAQASHYVSAMVWQSFDSFLYFSEAFVTDGYALAKTVSVCSNDGAVAQGACAAAQLIPVLGPALEALATGVSVLGYGAQTIQVLLATFDPDTAIGRGIVPMHRRLNQSLARASSELMVTVGAAVGGTFERLRTRHDVRFEPGRGAETFARTNVCAFDRVHVRESFGSPLAPSTTEANALDPTAVMESSRVARAKRVMGAVANATRFACDDDDGSSACDAGFGTRRTLGTLPLVPDALRPFFEAVPKFGQSRLLTFGSADAESLNRIRQNRRDGATLSNETPDKPYGSLAQGDVLASDDLYSLATPLLCDAENREDCQGDPERDPLQMMKTSIWAMSARDLSAGGIHWRLVTEGGVDGNGVAGLRQVKGCRVCSVWEVSAADVRAVRDGNHEWEGIVPFPHFDAGEFIEPCGESRLDVAASRDDDFNQPSVYLSARLSPSSLRRGDAAAAQSASSLLSSDGALSVGEGRRLELEARGSFPPWQPGINVIARAQVYYHRSGAWEEPPNFFNPYWRPRLAALTESTASRAVMSEALAEPHEGDWSSWLLH